MRRLDHFISDTLLKSNYFKNSIMYFYIKSIDARKYQILDEKASPTKFLEKNFKLKNHIRSSFFF